MQPIFTCTTDKCSFTTSTVKIPDQDGLTDYTIAMLKQSVEEALSRPAPLTLDFEKGFKERGDAGQIYAMLYADVIAMKTVLQIVKEPNESSKTDFMGTAWHGFLQCVYMSWLARFAGIYVKLEMDESQNGFQYATLSVRTTNDEGFTNASDFIADDYGPYFYHVLRDHGETVYSVESYAASISNGLLMLSTFEHAFLCSYNRCKEEADDGQSKQYFLSMAKAAYLVRSLALKWLLNGVTGNVIAAKPISPDLNIGKREIKKEALKQLEFKTIEAVLGLNFSELAFQLLARAQAALAPDAAAFVEHKTHFERSMDYFGLKSPCL